MEAISLIHKWASQTNHYLKEIHAGWGKRRKYVLNSRRNFKRWEKQMHSVNLHLDPDLNKSTVKHRIWDHSGKQHSVIVKSRSNSVSCDTDETAMWKQEDLVRDIWWNVTLQVKWHYIWNLILNTPAKKMCLGGSVS